MTSARLPSPVIALALLGLTSCGGGVDAHALVTFQLDAPPPAGGGYRLHVLRPNGTPVPGLEPRFVAVREGEQSVTVVLRDEALFGGGDTAAVRLYAEAVPTEQAAADDVLAAGSRVISVRTGEGVDATVRLVADPRPLTGDATASYASSPTGAAGPFVAVQAADVIVSDTGAEPEGVALVAWATVGQEAPTQIGVLDGSGATLGAIPIPEEGEDLTVTIVAEPSDQPEQLAVPLGWPVFTGALAPEMAAWMGVGGALHRAERLLQAAQSHAKLAHEATGEGGKRFHSEHVFNLLVAEEEQADLNGDGNPELVDPGDPAGIAALLGPVHAGGVALAESRDLPDIATAIQICGDNLLGPGQALEVAIAAADTAAAPGSNDTLTEDTVGAVDALLGEPFDDPLPPAATFLCLQDRIDAMASFPLGPVAP